MDKLNNLLVDAVDMGITIAVLLAFFILSMVLLCILNNTIGGRNEKDNSKDR